MSRKSLLRAVLFVLLVVVVTTMVVPYEMVEGLFRRYGWMGRTLDLLDTIAPGLEASHLLSFGILGFLARFCWPNRRAWKIALGILIVGVGVEVAQIWVPGREAAISHAVFETLGGWIGLLLAWVLTFAWGEESLPEYKHSTHWRGHHGEE